MPWCPQCKTEYKAGVEKCSDCGSLLVESLAASNDFDKSKLLNFLYGPEEHVNTIRKYLTNHGKMKAYCAYNEKKDIYELFINPEDQERAIVLVNQFMAQVNGQEVVQAKTAPAPSQQQRTPDVKAYKSVKERAADHKSSAIILISLGVIGLTVIILMATGVLSFVPLSGLGSIIMYVVMGAFFLMFIVMGILSAKSYKELKIVDSGEDNEIKKLDEFCKQNLTREIIDAKVSSLITDETQEYFYRAEYMRHVITNEFPNLTSSFVEDYIDTKYGELFE